MSDAPIVHLYAVCWNERPMLEHFFTHYDPWVDRYFIFDDGSDDGSLEMLEAHPKVVVAPFERGVPGSFVKSHNAHENQVWKRSRGVADWVVMVDIDEFLHHPRRSMKDYLAELTRQGVTIAPSLGYNMTADALPRPGRPLVEQIPFGAPSLWMNKPGLLRPDALESSGFEPGRHTASPKGRVRYPDRDEVLNLHYKVLGEAYFIERTTALKNRTTEADRDKGLVDHYFNTDEQNATVLRWHAERAVDIREGDPHRDHALARWWRPDPLPRRIAQGLRRLLTRR